MAVTHPLKLTLTNIPEDRVDWFDVTNNPEDEAEGKRQVPLTRELWIEREDFSEVPPPKFQRLKPGGEVRLMGAYIVRCNRVLHNDAGEVIGIEGTADLVSGNGNPSDGRKVRGTIHWVSAKHAVDAEIRLYDNLFTLENMNEMPEDKTYDDYLNVDSVKIEQGCKLEPSLKDAKAGERFQFVRLGYYIVDIMNPGTFNRIVSLKDSYKPQ